MRENRQSGSAGGEAGTTGLPYPDFNVLYTSSSAPSHQRLSVMSLPSQSMYYFMR